ncbi:MAG: hypothetical protein L3J14_07345 [Flavobacteriaceae bacterium]|nr:hypothetical protein [Flavobacteriaceae bacterium]
MRYKTILLASVITLFMSCDSNKKKTIDTSSIEIEGISLDNSKLWQANKETTEGVKKMQQIMQSFSDKENATAYASLKDELEEEFTTIFQKCTMKGEAHNQLHNFLKPMLPIFEGLESSDLKICKTNFKIMENHLAGYANYFE